jgi:hypothetical protein
MDSRIRTKENMLRQIVSLFNFARRQKYVPAELALELSEISTPKKQHAPIGIYTTDEMRAVLAAADEAVGAGHCRVCRIAAGRSFTAGLA